MRKITSAVAGTAMLAGAIVASAGPIASPASAETAPKRFVAGWLPYWTTDASNQRTIANADLMDNVSPFWFQAKWDGNSTYVNEHLSDARRAELLRELQGRGFKVVPSITDGTGYRRMAAVMKSDSLRRAHVNQLVNKVVDEGLDGIDLDYEGFAFSDGSSTWATTRPAWVQFVKDLSDKLHANGKILTTAVPPMYNDRYDGTSGYWVYDYKRIAPYMDNIRIMTYDYSWSKPGPIAPVAWVRSVAKFAKTQVPADKIQLGVPTYGYSWVVSHNCPSGASVLGKVAIDMKSIDSVVSANGGSPEWIADKAESRYVYNRTYTVNGKKCTAKREAWLPSVKSVMARAKVAGEEGLGGVAFWTIGGEDPAMWAPLRDYAKTLQQDPAPEPVAPTSLTVEATPRVRYGSNASVVGRALGADSKPAAGAPVTLSFQPAKSTEWITIETRSTGSKGRAKFSHMTRGNGTYRVQTGSLSASSKLVTVNAAVNARVPTSARAGSTVTLSGTVAPAMAGVTVTRQRYVNNKWTPITGGTAVTSASGLYSMTIKPPSKGTYVYRVVSSPFTYNFRDLNPGVSTTVKFVVK